MGNKLINILIKLGRLELKIIHKIHICNDSAKFLPKIKAFAQTLNSKGKIYVLKYFSK